MNFFGTKIDINSSRTKIDINSLDKKLLNYVSSIIDQIISDTTFDLKFKKPLTELSIKKEKAYEEPIPDLGTMRGFLNMIKHFSYNNTLFFLIPLKKEDTFLDSALLEMSMRFFQLFFYLAMPFSNSRHTYYCARLSLKEIPNNPDLDNSSSLSGDFILLIVNFPDDEKLSLLEEDILQIRFIFISFFSYLLQLFRKEYPLFYKQNEAFKKGFSFSNFLKNRCLVPNFYALINEMSFYDLNTTKVYSVFTPDFLEQITSWLKEVHSIPRGSFVDEDFFVYVFYSYKSVSSKTDKESFHEDHFSIFLHRWTELMKRFLLKEVCNASSSFNENDGHSDPIFNYIHYYTTTFQSIRNKQNLKSKK